MTNRIVPKKTRDDVYRFLFTEGVIACKKDRLATWQGILGGKKFQVAVHHVWYLMRSLESRGFVREQFAWRHFYWFLNDEGIAYLRQYFHLADSVVPNSMKPLGEGENFEKRRPRPDGEGGRGRGRGRGGAPGRGRGGYGADRAAYQGGEGGRGRGRGGFRGRGRGGAEGEAPAPAPAQE